MIKPNEEPKSNIDDIHRNISRSVLPSPKRRRDMLISEAIEDSRTIIRDKLNTILVK
ncbi:hypothetical protein [Prochlorococcus marinus]|uniref:hypothetical protein n=1 Tax=Prochlorococcus marinus TaxID=1219 RepID=UPI00131EFA66|nr:hypothetical protein [Prochlorococcus marinus]